jgi:nucleotide-binding universal stress UspA family protein
VTPAPTGGPAARRPGGPAARRPGGPAADYPRRMPDAGLVLIGYDGSESADRAIAGAGPLLAPRPALVVTAWEPGVAYEALSASGFPTVQTIDFGAAAAVDQAMYEGARRTAERGVGLAREAGFSAEGLVVSDPADVAATLARLAADRGAQVIVVGTRGRNLETRLMGSTSRRLAERAHCPVLVVPEPEG